MAIWYRAHQHNNGQYVFSGDGGLYVAGRWNHLGKKAVYCSQSIALATIEWLSHNGLSVSGFNYYRYSIDIPDHLVSTISSSQLPMDWSATPARDSTRDFADTYLFSPNRSLAMAIPSVLVPEEYNLIINPLHSDFFRIASSIRNLGQFVAPIR